MGWASIVVVGVLWVGLVEGHGNVAPPVDTEKPFTVFSLTENLHQLYSEYRDELLEGMEEVGRELLDDPRIEGELTSVDANGTLALVEKALDNIKDIFDGSSGSDTYFGAMVDKLSDAFLDKLGVQAGTCSAQAAPAASTQSHRAVHTQGSFAQDMVLALSYSAGKTGSWAPGGSKNVRFPWEAGGSISVGVKFAGEESDAPVFGGIGVGVSLSGAEFGAGGGDCKKLTTKSLCVEGSKDYEQACEWNTRKSRCEQVEGCEGWQNPRKCRRSGQDCDWFEHKTPRCRKFCTFHNNEQTCKNAGCRWYKKDITLPSGITSDYVCIPNKECHTITDLDECKSHGLCTVQNSLCITNRKCSTLQQSTCDVNANCEWLVDSCNAAVCKLQKNLRDCSTKKGCTWEHGVCRTLPKCPDHKNKAECETGKGPLRCRWENKAGLCMDQPGCEAYKTSDCPHPQCMWDGKECRKKCEGLSESECKQAGCTYTDGDGCRSIGGCARNQVKDQCNRMQGCTWSRSTKAPFPYMCKEVSGCGKYGDHTKCATDTSCKWKGSQREGLCEKKCSSHSSSSSDCRKARGCEWNVDKNPRCYDATGCAATDLSEKICLSNDRYVCTWRSSESVRCVEEDPECPFRRESDCTARQGCVWQSGQCLQSCDVVSRCSEQSHCTMQGSQCVAKAQCETLNKATCTTADTPVKCEVRNGRCVERAGCTKYTKGQCGTVKGCKWYGDKSKGKCETECKARGMDECRDPCTFTLGVCEDIPQCSDMKSDTCERARLRVECEWNTTSKSCVEKKGCSAKRGPEPCDADTGCRWYQDKCVPACSTHTPVLCAAAAGCELTGEENNRICTKKAVCTDVQDEEKCRGQNRCIWDGTRCADPPQGACFPYKNRIECEAATCAWNDGLCLADCGRRRGEKECYASGPLAPSGIMYYRCTFHMPTYTCRKLPTTRDCEKRSPQSCTTRRSEQPLLCVLKGGKCVEETALMVGGVKGCHIYTRKEECEHSECLWKSTASRCVSDCSGLADEECEKIGTCMKKGEKCVPRTGCGAHATEQDCTDHTGCEWSTPEGIPHGACRGVAVPPSGESTRGGRKLLGIPPGAERAVIVDFFSNPGSFRGMAFYLSLTVPDSFPVPFEEFHFIMPADYCLGIDDFFPGVIDNVAKGNFGFGFQLSSFSSEAQSHTLRQGWQKQWEWMKNWLGEFKRKSLEFVDQIKGWWKGRRSGQKLFAEGLGIQFGAAFTVLDTFGGLPDACAPPAPPSSPLPSPTMSLPILPPSTPPPSPPPSPPPPSPPPSPPPPPPPSPSPPPPPPLSPPPAPPTTTFRTGRHLSQAPPSSAVSSVEHKLLEAQQVLSKGELTAPFCVGDCAEADRDPATAIWGVARVGQPPSCDGIDLSVWADKVSIGGVVHVLTGGAPESVAGALRTMAAPLGSVGMRDARLGVTARMEGIDLTAEGALLLPKPDEGGGEFAKVVRAVVSGVESLRIKSKAELRWGDGAKVSLELRVGTAADTDQSKRFAITDAKGKLGLSVFVQTETIYRLPIPTMYTGVTFPCRICVSGCDTATPRNVYLQGDLKYVSNAGLQQIQGDLKLQGVWDRAFGVPFLHISNLLFGIGYTIGAPVPITAIKAGGTVCLGKWSACDPAGGVGTSIKGSMYVSANAGLPNENWFVGMVRGLTLGNVLEIAEDYIGKAVFDKVPDKVRSAGIYPFMNHSRCWGEESQPQPRELGEMDYECYALFSYSPFEEQKLEFGNQSIEIPVGVQLSGRFVFYDNWGVSIKLVVSSLHFLLDGAVDPVDLRIKGQPVLSIGSHLVDGPSGYKLARGRARMLIELKAQPPSALINITGAISIPVLRSSGSVTMKLNSELFSFESNIDLFGGALSAYAKAEWDWKMTYFNMTLGDVSFLFGAVHFRGIRFAYDSKAKYAVLDVHITVMFVAGIGARVEVEGSEVRFDVAVEAGGLARAGIRGKAQIASPFSRSKFSLDPYMELGPLGEKVKEWVTNAARAVADFAVKTWNKVKEGVTKVWNKVTNFFTNGGLKDIAHKIGDFLNRLGDVLADAVETLKKVPVLGSLVEMGEKLLKGDFKGLGKKIGEFFGFSPAVDQYEVWVNGRDEFGCRLKALVTRSCRYFLGIKTSCSHRRSRSYGEQSCIRARVKDAENVKSLSVEASQKQKTLDRSKERNPSLEFIHDRRNEIPTRADSIVLPTMSADEAENPQTKMAGVRLHVRPLSGERSGLADEEEVVVDTPLDLSTLDGLSRSLRNLESRAAGVVKEKALGTQEGLENDPNIQVGAGIFVPRPPELGHIPDLEAYCDGDVNLNQVGVSHVSFVDPKCTRGVRVEMVGVQQVPNVNANSCGSYYLQVSWQAFDSPLCGGSSQVRTQMITVYPTAPEFETFPLDVTVSNLESVSPEETGEPMVESLCNFETGMSWEDKPAVPHPTECGRWVIERVWKAFVDFEDTNTCRDAGHREALSTTRSQFITVVDREAPVFDKVPPNVEIPYFASFGEGDALPHTSEPVHPTLRGRGVVSYPTTLTATDGEVVFHTETSDEEACRARGLATMMRTWAVEDRCGNRREHVQRITVQHPPTAPVATQKWNESRRLFAVAPGVRQLADPCQAGKMVSRGVRDVDPLDATEGNATDACGEGEWAGDGCRVRKVEGRGEVEVRSVPPYFTTFPRNLTIFSNQTLAPAALGEPSGRAFCDTPVHIWHADDPPVLRGCGVWTVLRRWKVQPWYGDCGTEDRYPDSHTTVRVQEITVLDVFPPSFTYAPKVDVTVPFLGNYGPSATGVPEVEDPAHPDMAARGMYSYNVTLWYEDADVTFPSPERGCANDIARLTRVWRARDRCGHLAVWNQTVRVEHPQRPRHTTGVVANASTFQVFGVGRVEVRDSVVEGKVASPRAVHTDRSSTGAVVSGEPDTCEGESLVFEKVGDDIADFSEALFNLPQLRAGPRVVTCTAPQQCATTNRTAPTRTRVMQNDTAMVLEGDGDVYNIFELAMNDWLIRTPEKRYNPGWWLRSEPQYLPPLPKATLHIEARGFVVVNVGYTHISQTKDTLRDPVFGEHSLGASHTLFNLKQLCEFDHLCRHHQHRKRGTADWSTHHVFHLHWHVGEFFDWYVGENRETLALRNATLPGSMVSQDEFLTIDLDNCHVDGHVISSGLLIHLSDTHVTCQRHAACSDCS